LIDKIVDEEDDELGLSIPYEDDEEEEMDETKLFKGILQKFVLMQGSKCLFLRLSEYFLMREFLPNGR
jgi:hypothetical protein